MNSNNSESTNSQSSNEDSEGIKENKSDAMMHDMMIGWLIVYVFNVHPHESFLQNPIINHTVVATSPRISAELHNHNDNIKMAIAVS